MRFGRWSALLVAPLLFGCETPAAPVLIVGAERFLPPAAYQLWWEITVQCSGRRAPLSRVRWYVVPGARTVAFDGEQYAGYWSSAGNSIVLAEAAMFDGPLVRHEMLHSLIQAGTHHREEFLERCGGVVLCDERCIADAEPLLPADPAVARVGPDALEVDVAVSPQAPSRLQHGGYFTMTVMARNPNDHPVVVTLPPSGDAEPPVTFEYQAEHPGGLTGLGDRALDEGVTRFAPGETKRRVFDFHIVGADESTLGGGLRPGTYDLRGAYGKRWAPATTITLSSP